MIQINMEMPDSCRECWFLNYDMYSGRTSCAIEDMTLAQYFKALDFEGRHEECPLIDVLDIHFGNISEFSKSSTDCISRQAVIEINRSYHGKMPNEVNYRIWKEVTALPSVQQEPCDDPRADVYYLAEKNWNSSALCACG